MTDTNNLPLDGTDNGGSDNQDKLAQLQAENERLQSEIKKKDSIASRFKEQRDKEREKSVDVKPEDSNPLDSSQGLTQDKVAEMIAQATQKSKSEAEFNLSLRNFVQQNPNASEQAEDVKVIAAELRKANPELLKVLKVENLFAMVGGNTKQPEAPQDLVVSGSDAKVKDNGKSENIYEGKTRDEIREMVSQGISGKLK